MTRTTHPALAALAALLLACSAAHAGSADIPDEVNARIARSKSLQAAESAQRAREAAAQGLSADGSGVVAASALGNGCNIAIGNVIEDKKPGISTSARRETTVIITGDVIQVGNNCK